MCNLVPGFGAVFTTLHFLCKLWMRPISESVTFHKAGKACYGQNSSFLCPFVTCEENEVLSIKPKASIFASPSVIKNLEGIQQI